MALAAGEDGLDFYRALARHYQTPLRPGGTLALEIGWQQREAVCALLQAEGWTQSPLHPAIWAAMTAASWPKDRKKDLLLSLKIKQLPVVISWICGILKGNRTAAF